MKPLPKPGIIISQQPLSAKIHLVQRQETISNEEFPYVIPRVYPNHKIPLRVSIDRKIKQYNSFNLNDHLKGIDWGEGQLKLVNFIQAPQYIFEYGCTQSNIEKGKLRGRAYNEQKKQFETFLIKQWCGLSKWDERYWFIGIFNSGFNHKKDEEQKIHRSQICFDFQDPTKYTYEVSIGIKRRKRVIERLKYQFLVDNIDFEGAPMPSDRVLKNIKKFTKGLNLIDFDITYSDMILVHNHYQRTMNQIMFRHEVKQENLPIKLPNKYHKKSDKQTKIKRSIKFVKDNKVICLVPKTVKKRTKDFQTKSLFISDNITRILVELKRKLNGPINDLRLFKQVKDCVIEKFYAEQQRENGAFYSAFNEFIIEPLASLIKDLLMEEAEGWFRMYDFDREAYMCSKLRRLVIMINNQIKDYAKAKLAIEIQRFCKFLQKNTPTNIKVESILRVSAQYDLGIELSNILELQLQINEGQLVLSHSPVKIIESMKKMLRKVLIMFKSIPSIEPLILREIFGNPKFHEGIKLQMPHEIVPDREQMENNPNLIEDNMTTQIKQHTYRFDKTIERIVEPLVQYIKVLNKTVEDLELKTIMKSKNSFEELSEIMNAFNSINKFSQKFSEIFMQSNGTKVGFFYIDFTLIKRQITDHLGITKQSYRRNLIELNNKMNRLFYARIKELLRSMLTKPRNVYELMEKNRKLKNLDQILADQMNIKDLKEIRRVCEEFGCKLNMEELKIETENQKIVSQIYGSKDLVEKQFQEMKKQEIGKVSDEKEDIQQNFKMIKITLNNLIALDMDVSKYKENAQKVNYMRERLQSLKLQNGKLIQKLKILEIQHETKDLASELEEFQSNLSPYQILWNAVDKWEALSQVWLYEPIGNFTLKDPEIIIKQLLENFKKIIKEFLLRGEDNPRDIANKYKNEIEQFEPKLRLLKIIKKQGFSKSHLEQIDIFVKKQMQFVSLNEAIEMGFLDRIDQIETISNDAWNQFSLEQTLQRVSHDINILKFEMSHYLDKKSNKILMITNLKPLIQSIDRILSNLDSVQFNPMKMLCEGQIKHLYEKSLYISNSIKICEDFQYIFIELHPIFDSTDIVKQMPSENKKFAKVLRIWLELLEYLKNVRSVNDSCNSQNIYEKVKSILNSIEKIKKSLIDYLQTKRKGFSRFYLLSNSEMFQLFAMSSDISKISIIISKLFDSVNSLIIDQTNTKITGISTSSICEFMLNKPVEFININVEIWMNMLEKEISGSILSKIEKSINQENDAGMLSASSISFTQKMKRISKQKTENKKKQIDNEYYWVDMIRSEAQFIPQIAYLLFQIQFTKQIEEKILKIEDVVQKYEKILASLVEQKKQTKYREISKLKQIILGSFITLSISKVQIAKQLSVKRVSNSQSFEFKKIMRSTINPMSDIDEDYVKQKQIVNQNYSIKVKIFNHETEYGYHYLGMYSRLVITDVTQRMFMVYMLANQYSLGCAAIGPAGTGKSETTKQIAKVNGKTCIIYNCSQNFDSSTLIRLLKALSVAGLWMCFDQFNRLSPELLSIIAEQLSFLHRIRNFKHRMQINFMGSHIMLNPSFQLCVTYNPTYQGRQTIPQNVHELFRNMALVKPDELTISISLLLSAGFKMGKILGEKIVKIFSVCRKIWGSEGLYDFSLRALKSIIDLGTKFQVQNQQSEESSLISALNILNLPKMDLTDRLEFQKIIRHTFPESLIIPVNKSITQQRLQDFQQIIKVRDGVLLCGPPLSGKKMMLTQFMLSNQENWEFEEIYHDVLDVQDLYGSLDPSTKLWNDGMFTQLLRKHIKLLENQSFKNSLIIFNGSVYSQWVQNLNSVLDSTRKLSLSSGEIIDIPSNFKILISCIDLKKATPATISRSGVIIYEPRSLESIIEKNNKFPKRILVFMKDLLDQIKSEYKYIIESRFILFWVNEMFGDSPITYDTFIYYLTQIMEGILTETGREIYDRYCRAYLSISQSPFNIILKNNSEPHSLDKEFQKHIQYEKYMKNSCEQEQLRNPVFQQVFIETEAFYKISEINKHYLSRNCKKLLLIFGYENVGKSRYFQQFFKTLSQSQYKYFKVFLTKQTRSKNVFDSLRNLLTKKSSNKLGASPGLKNHIFIQDINLPDRNQYDILDVCELMRIMTEKGSWYNYRKLEEQYIEDVSLFGDARLYNLQRKDLNISTRIYRDIEPIFQKQILMPQIQTIFKGIFQRFFPGPKHNQINQILENLVQFYYYISKNSQLANSRIKINLMDIRKALKGLLAWKTLNNPEITSKLCLFEISRTILSKVSEQNRREQLYRGLQQCFKSRQIPLFHNLEGSNTSALKCQEVINVHDFTNKIQYICDQFCSLNNYSETIIVFPDLIEYLIKIYRTIELNDSHCCVIGLSKCGKKNLIKLASYLISSELNYAANKSQAKQWHQSIKSSIRNCYKSKNSTIFLIEHRQLEEDYRMNEINTLLNTMNLDSIYSEADHQQVVFMVQVQLVKKNIEINKENAWKQLCAFIKQKLHIVILLNPSYQTFDSKLANYPSILKYCSIFNIRPWPQQGLNLIAKLQMPDINENLDFLSKIHQFCAQICKDKNSVLASIWQGMYFDFISLLKHTYEKNDTQLNDRKNTYDKGLKIIEETEQQLTKTKNKIKKLQPAILLMESQTSKTVKNLTIQKKAAHEKNESLILKNAELEKIIKQSRIVKAELQVKVALVNQKLEKAWENVSLIKPSHISEVKALANPSQFIKTVLSALVILTYDGPLSREVIEKNGHQYVEQSYFETAKKHVLSKDAKSICRLLTQFKRQNVNKQMFSKLEEKCLSYKRWGQKEAKSANKAIYYFFLWVDAVANQYRIFEETQPLRDQLETTSNLLNEKEREVAQIKIELQVLQAKIQQLETSHATKKVALQEYRVQIAKFQRMLNRGYQLLKQIEKEKNKWNIYINNISEKLKNNFGDSILMAASIIYVSPHIYETRKIIKKKIKGLCQEYGIQSGVTNIPWFFTREEQQNYHTLQIYENQFVVDNLKIIQNSPMHSYLLLDPEEQGVNYIKKLNWQQLQIPIDKVSENSPKIIKTLQSAILYGRIVFIEVNPQFFNENLRFVVKPIVISNELKANDKNIPIHENYRLYLYATSFVNKECSTQLLANTQSVNFKMTLDQLHERIMEAVISIELPFLKNKIQEIYKVNIKDTLTLSNIEDKLLTLFSQQITAEQILESQEIIGTVVHSNRLYKQIQGRVLESNQQKSEIKNEIKPYESKVNKVCLLYENILRLKLVSPFYAYSYQWFIDLFENNIHNFQQSLFRSLSKALKTQQKIIASVLIAQITHPSLPWNCLFNSRENTEQVSIFNSIFGGNSPEQPDILSTIQMSLGIFVKQLPVSQKKWNKIVSRVKKVQKYIPGLQRAFIERCEIFRPLVHTDFQHLLEQIPNQFSNLDFFYRILLVSCFRPEWVIKLLEEWIQINMGPNYVDFEPSLASLPENTKPTRPILVVLDEIGHDPVNWVKQIYKHHHKGKGEEATTPIISVHWSDADQQTFSDLIKGGVSQDQWIVIQGGNSQGCLQFIKNMFEQIMILPEKIFRIWVIHDDQSIFENRLTQFYDKIRIIPHRNLKKNITESFYEHFGEVKKKTEDYFEKNKKKLMISQLCIFHHVLEEFLFYNRLIYKNNNKKPIYTYTVSDLRLILSEVAPYDVEATLKDVLQYLICKLTYGSQIRTRQLTILLQTNAKLFLDGIITDRNTFWQTLWSDQKFPKTQSEYQHELKTRMTREKYLEIFGINEKVKQSLNEHNYERICQFYEKTTFQESANVSSIISQRLMNLNQEIKGFDFWQFEKQLNEKIEYLGLKQHTKKYITYFKKEGKYYIEKYQHIIDDLQYYGRVLNDQQKNHNKEAEEFRFSIFLDKIPENWQRSRKNNTILSYIMNLKQRMKSLLEFIDCCSNTYYPVNCETISNPFLFFNIMTQNQTQQPNQKQDYFLVFEMVNAKIIQTSELQKYFTGQTVTIQQKSHTCSPILKFSKGLVMVRNLYCWNFMFVENQENIGIIKRNIKRQERTASKASDRKLGSNDTHNTDSEFKTYGAIMMIEKTKHTCGIIKDYYINMPAFQYSIDDIAEDHESVIDLYTRSDEMSHEEIIRQNCHLSFKI